jgi:lipopolysaccharide export system permease protein
VLFRTILGYAAVGTVLVLLLAHVVEPAATREGNLIRAQAAADLVGNSLVPNRFAELGEGVTITVGGRGAGGEITSFFADDRRDTTRRTYIADSALITADEFGYVLQLANGTIQYRTADGQFSEISFQRYDIALERLTGDADTGSRRGDQSTYGMIMRGLTEGEWPAESLRRIAERTSDGFRVLALCLFVAAISGFPQGRRKEPLLPVEITVLGAVLFERTLMTYAPVAGWAQQTTGVIVLMLISVAMLLYRLRVFVPMPREAHGT